MRVSPVGFAFNTEDEVLSEAEKTANISHNHPEGIKGAQATALAVFLARMGYTKEQLGDGHTIMHFVYSSRKRLFSMASFALLLDAAV
jgi:ADP-ribosylglycohydrolase